MHILNIHILTQKLLNTTEILDLLHGITIDS